MKATFDIPSFRISWVGLCVLLSLLVVGCGQMGERQDQGTDQAHDSQPYEQSQPLVATIVVRADGLDEKGSRVPVTIAGTKEDGTQYSNTMYLSQGDNRIELSTGSYDVSVLESPIAADGALYTIPAMKQKVSTKEEQGTPENVSFELRALAPAEVTDAQIEAARAYIEKDEERSTAASELVLAAKRRRDEAIAADDERYTLHLDGFDFVIPSQWRNKVKVQEESSSVKLAYSAGARTWTLLQLGKDILGRKVFSERGTFASLDNGNQWCTLPVDDAGVIGIVLSPSKQSAEMATYRFSENDERLIAGLDGVQPGDWRRPLELQAAVAGLPSTEDPEKIAEACLHEVATRIAFAEVEEERFSIPGGTFALPEPWKGRVVWDGGKYAFSFEGRPVLMFGQASQGFNERVAHLGLVKSYTLQNGGTLQITYADDGYYAWRVSAPSGSAIDGMISNGTWDPYEEKGGSVMEAYRGMLAQTAGASAGTDSEETACECMRVCAENISFG